jgi:hypothetical protein
MQASHPAKEVVRHWLRDQINSGKPPKTPEQIRRELGWGLILPTGKK